MPPDPLPPYLFYSCKIDIIETRDLTCLDMMFDFRYLPPDLLKNVYEMVNIHGGNINGNLVLPRLEFPP